MFLTAIEEYTLARNNQDGDVRAGQKLATAHMPLVKRIAKDFRGYGLAMEDLISEGCVGLMEAVKRFDPDQGARFGTYAAWWIKASIREYARRSRSVVRGAERDSSLNAPVGDSGREWQDTLPDELESQEDVLADRQERDFRHDLLRRALGMLNEVERQIIEHRHLKAMATGSRSGPPKRKPCRGPC